MDTITPTNSNTATGEETKTEAKQENVGSPSSGGAITFQGTYNPQQEIEKLRGDNKKDLEKINYLFYGLVIFVAISFLIEIYSMNMDRIKDKDLYLNYNSMYKDFFDAQTQQQKDVQDIKTSVELLKAKNPYLK